MVADKMVRTKWYTDKMVLDKIVWTKRYEQNGRNTNVRIKSSINRSRSHWQYEFFINQASTL